MLSKWLTEILVLLAVGLGVACVCLWLHEHDIYLFRSFWKRVRKMSIIGLCAAVLWAVPFVQLGGTKGDGGTGTTGILPVEGQRTEDKGQRAGGDASNVQSPEASVLCPSSFVLTSTNTTRTITADDFRRGFIMTRVGTGEAFDFSAPAGATVCADWRAFGAATDWIYESVKWKVESVKWRMGNGDAGTGNETQLRIHSDGWAEVKDGPVFSPFKAVLGIVPEANWQQILHFTLYTLHSQFWHYVTPSNTLQITWQNALLDRDTDTPLSFQIEFRTDGQFTYRYDLSRCGGRGATALPAGIITNVVVGASFAGNDWTTNAIPTNVTSMTFYPLSAEDAVNPDPDNDGLATIDELFVYHTDPRHPDSDYDGLTDYEELFVYHTDPLDPYSAGGPYSDGVTVKIGDLDPFSYPEGSTNTVLEHIFYSGTTNGAFTYPQSDNDTAILKVMVSGVGTGRLIVGDSVVPLIAPPQMRSGTATNILLLAVGRGVRKEVWFDKPEGLDVAKKSDDFFIGEMPSPLWPHGWLAFPHTEATVPCIHDFNTRTKLVTLVHGEEFPGMTATWDNGGNEDVVISNIPPVSASIGGNFPKNTAREISYTLHHPKCLNESQITITQPLRFCPEVSPQDETNIVGVAALDTPDSPDEWDDGDSTPQPLDDDDTEEEEAFTNIVNGALLPLYDVLYLYRDNTRTEYLEVPNGLARPCCPCPEHKDTNYVAKVSYTGNVEVRDSDGNYFNTAYSSCTVTLSGTGPSYEFYDSPVLFVTNGAPYKVNNYTVLGVGFKSGNDRPALSNYNHRSSYFGYPVAVCTNLYDANSIILKTDVLLSNGVVRVSLEDTSGDVALWLPEWRDNENMCHPAELLLQAGIRTVRHFTIRQWRNVMRRYEQTRQLAVRVISSCQSRCKVKFEFAVTDGTYYAYDHAEQWITTVNPILLVDYNRDGTIDGTDVAWYLAKRIVYFWRNDDEWRYDDAFDTSWMGLLESLNIQDPCNSSNDVIDGRNDLINFLPVAVDVSPFASHWDPNTVYYRLETSSSSLRKAKLAFADIDWTQIGNAQLGTDSDIDGNSLTNAPVFKLESGTNLPPAFVSLSQSGRSTLFMEFPDFAKNQYFYLNIYSKSDNALLFSSKIELHVGDVSKMLGWLNLRDAAGGTGGVATHLSTEDWPPETHEPGNVVFVHGYNMHEGDETKLWAQNVFKKLWWAGLDRGFIAVQWRGNEGQVFEVLTPNYYGNVQNAFQTALALSNAMQTVQGPKWFIAHSLGNMLVSAAIQDYGMEYEKYFMLNAAIAMEAFDPTGGITQESHDKMTPAAWTNYTDRVRATHWFERFPEGDGRRLLTWKGRFANVTNIVNFYSTQEEVVNNGDGDWHTLAERNYVWYNQETLKGVWPLMLHEYEGGWEFNGYYNITTNYWIGNMQQTETCHMPPADADQLSNEQLQQIPFFLDFHNPEMHTSPNGAIVANNYLYRAEMLAYAIPAESFAVGANPLPALNAYTNTTTGTSVPKRNFNMAEEFTTGLGDLPENHATDTKKKHRDWQHSTFVQRSYKRVHLLYKVIIQYIKETHNE